MMFAPCSAQLLNPTVAGNRPRGVLKAEPHDRRSTRILQLQKAAEDRVADLTSLTPPAAKGQKRKVVCASIAPSATLIILT